MYNEVKFLHLKVPEYRENKTKIRFCKPVMFCFTILAHAVSWTWCLICKAADKQVEMTFVDAIISLLLK